MQESSIAKLAVFIIAQLKAVTAKYTFVLTDPSYTKDPIAEAERQILAMDAKLAAKDNAGLSHKATPFQIIQTPNQGIPAPGPSIPGRTSYLPFQGC